MASRIRLNAVAACLLATVACAHVSQDFATWEGPDPIRVGQGGTKTTTDGVEFWTMGAPARRFQILGVLTDSRRNNVVGRSSYASDVARVVRDAGGTAVLVVSQQNDYVGTYNSGSATATTYGRTTQATGYGYSAAITNRTSQFIVIKYLE